MEIEATCCFCNDQIGPEDVLVALCWIDPHGIAVAAHYLCTSPFDGLPAWPRPRRWLKKGKA